MRSLWLLILVLCVSVGACASCKSNEKPITHVEVIEEAEEYPSAYESEGVEGSERRYSSAGYGSVGTPVKRRSSPKEATPRPTSASEPMKVVIEEPPPASWVDTVIDSLRVGDIAFSTPESVRLNETTSVVLLLSLQKHAESLARVLEGRVETAEGIKISPEMEAVLVGDGFKITPVTPTKQVVGSFNTTRWEWKITPNTKGNQELHLSLNARVQVEGKDSPYVVQTFTKRILVEVTLADTFRTFLKENWQWLWTTILLPLLIWYFKLRRKRQTTS